MAAAPSVDVLAAQITGVAAQLTAEPARFTALDRLAGSACFMALPRRAVSVASPDSVAEARWTARPTRPRPGPPG